MPKRKQIVQADNEVAFEDLSEHELNAIWKDLFPNAKTDEEIAEELENC